MVYGLDKLREVLCDYYPADGAADVVGYLKGSGDPNVWRLMARQQQPQMVVLGSLPPTPEDWVAAGKPSAQDPVQTIHTKDLDGFIILYGGFVRRPWGRIELVDADATRYYQASTIDNFRNNRLKPRR
jgi:hypothetical protein